MAPGVGLVGCGRWGSKILRDLLVLDARVIVADPSPEARATALLLGAAAVVEHGAALDDARCAGYVIAAPIPSLAAAAEELLRRGKPVFCEKPVFTNDGERQRLLAAGAAERLFAMYKFCYHPGIDALRSIVATGELGPLEAIVLQRHGWDEDFQGTDCLWLAGVHQLSIAHRLLGSLPAPESVRVARHDGLIAAASFTLGETPPVMITVSSRHPAKTQSAAVLCSRGSALLPDAYANAIVVAKAGQAAEKRTTSGAMPLLLELEEFLAYLSGGGRPRCGFEMAERVASAVVEIRRLADAPA